MKIIIELPDDQYEIIKSEAYHTFPAKMKKWGLEAIKNGTPLPTVHGRLIDADELKKHIYYDMCRFEKSVPVTYIDWANTIIPAAR